MTTYRISTKGRPDELVTCDRLVRPSPRRLVGYTAGVITHVGICKKSTTVQEERHDRDHH